VEVSKDYTNYRKMKMMAYRKVAEMQQRTVEAVRINEV